VAAQRGRPTGGQVAEGLPLLAAQSAPRLCQESFADGSEYIADFRSRDYGLTRADRASSGLVTEAIRSTETAV
jgi:hypothetical protein